MNNEELFDKFLNDTMTAEEQAEFELRLQDEQFGQELVAYTVEVRDFVHMADKLEKHDARKTVTKIKTIRQLPPQRPKRRRSPALIPLLGVAALLALSAWYILLLPKEVTVNDGSVKLVSTGSPPQFGRIPLNSKLSCSEKSSLKFLDDTAVSFEAGSVFMITSLEPKSVKLISGGLRAAVTSQSSGAFSVWTQDGVIKVIGTEFSVSKPEGGNTSLLVDKGRVSIANGKDEAVVNAGEAALMDADSRIILGSASQLPELKWKRWKNDFIKEKDLRLYINFESGLKNLALHKFDYELKLLTGQYTAGRFKSKKAMFDGKVELVGSEGYLNETLTVFAWVKPGDTGTHQPIITKGDFSWRVQLGAKNYNTHLGYGGLFDEGEPVIRDEWSFFAAVIDGNSATLYLNGKKSATIERGSVSTDKFPIQIGGNSTNTERLFRGLIGEVGLLERVLTEEEILNIYKNSRP